MNSKRFSPDYAERSRKLARRWSELCSRHLPVAPEDSMWRYSDGQRSGEPEQGWKLHVSATALNATRVLEKIAPALESLGVPFKGPSSLEVARRLNSGIHHPYSQVGKIFTVYPRNEQEAVSVARLLHGLTRGMSAPAVPFDLRYRPGSNIYYRYGAFKQQEMELPGGGRVSAVRNPQGEMEPDLRAPGAAKPVWAEDPFVPRRWRRAARTADSPLKTTFRVIGALSQRGKGGVYQAVDLSSEPPRLCLLKEGRKAGEVGWDGLDGRRRVRREARVLTLLRESGVDAPRVYGSFETSGNYYLVMEYIEGESLQSYLSKLQRRIPVARVLRYGIQLSGFIAQIHAAGWVWRDCKPANLVITKRGELRPLDFEGACPIDSPDPLPWMTPAFTPPGGDESQSGVCDDLYALGAVIYLLLTGRMPDPSPDPLPARRLRRNIPTELCELLSELISPGARPRPDANDITRRLKALLDRIANQCMPHLNACTDHYRER
jgi:hypothetical protein